MWKMCALQFGVLTPESSEKAMLGHVYWPPSQTQQKPQEQMKSVSTQSLATLCLNSNFSFPPYSIILPGSISLIWRRHIWLFSENWATSIPTDTYTKSNLNSLSYCHPLSDSRLWPHFHGQPFHGQILGLLGKLCFSKRTSLNQSSLLITVQ